MTRQETFNIVWAGAKAQGFEKSFGRSVCLYRGPFGRKCNAGWLIAEEDYSPLMEGAAIASLISEGRFKNFPHDRQYASELQAVHDNSRDAQHHEQRLRAYADAYNLSIPE